MMNTMLNTMTRKETRAISAFGITDLGRVRKLNEDALLLADLVKVNFSVGTRTNTAHLNERGAMLVVADGMSGAAAGEVASELAITTLRHEFTHGSSRHPIRRRLKEAVEKANHRIWDLGQRQREFRGMGSTLTAAIIRDGVAYIAQVGDSRAYLIRGSGIHQITKDQSLVQQLVDVGLLDAGQAMHHPYRNILTQALGSEPTVNVAITEFLLRPGDHLLLCSDGLSDKIRPEEMRHAVQQLSNVSDACRHLIGLANRRGGEDNITAIVARFDGKALSTTGNFRLDNKAMKSRAAAN